MVVSNVSLSPAVGVVRNVPQYARVEGIASLACIYHTRFIISMMVRRQLSLMPSPAVLCGQVVVHHPGVVSDSGLGLRIKLVAVVPRRVVERIRSFNGLVADVRRCRNMGISWSLDRAVGVDAVA